MKEEREHGLEYYPIYIHTNENSSASGFAPGVPGLFFAGEDIEECINDAKSAFIEHFDLLFEGEQPIPTSTKVEQHLPDEACKDGFWFMIEVNTSKYRKQIYTPSGPGLEFQATIDTSDSSSSWQGLHEDSITAKNYMLRSILTHAITEQLKRRKLTNTDAAKLLGISHTGISVLLNAKLEKFGLDELVDIIHKLGFRICLDVACN